MSEQTHQSIRTEVMLENLQDLFNSERGRISSEQIRLVVIPNAVVNPHVTLVSLPTMLIQELGLEKMGSRRITGGGEADMYSAVRLTIMDRSCTMDVIEVPDDVPVLIGQIPLEHLDLVIDMREHKLIGNPAHDGEHVYELY
ncbi:MAG: hypothetical protein IID45_14535 [Planctomycetes bacterium]|nr:hypothetical protein [Planctomycetota bacterium]